MVDSLIASYQKRFRKYGGHSKTLKWEHAGAKHQRMRHLTGELNFSGKTVLDVGCGFGDVIWIIKKRTKDFDYTGVDIVPEFIDVAKKRYPGHRFLVGDYFSNPLAEDFDIVLCSGALNSNVPDKQSLFSRRLENNMEWRKRAIATMWEQTKRALAFNMSGSHPQPENREDNNTWYADSLEILKYCLTLTRKVILLHHYHATDFTVILFKKTKDTLSRKK